jgi:16S rRNA G966 N2-methylase RsmD
MASPPDSYQVPAFRRNITATKATAIYAMHSYHQGKKPHDAIRQYIRHYTRPGDLVLDPFCGSGGTALAALIEGRTAAALDRSPAAVFIAGNYCTPADPAELEAEFGRLMAAVRPELDWLYATRCDACGGAARTSFTVWSQRYECPRCGNRPALFDCAAAEGHTAAGKPKKIAACPVCLAAGHVEEIRTRSPRLGATPVLAAYRCLADRCGVEGRRRHDDPDPRKRHFFEEHDLGKIREIETLDIPYWRPTQPFPKTFARWQTDLRPAGVDRVDQLYTRRNLWALAALRDHAARSLIAPRALFALTAVCLAVSKMQRYSPRSGFPNMLLAGTYYLPPIGREIEVGGWYAGKVRAMLRGYQAIRAARPPTAAACIAAADARRLPLPPDCVDYIFTDPPYADAVQYGELNFVWEAWLRAEADWHGDEIVVNAARGNSEADWTRWLLQAMVECRRVLKPGRWLSLCYHDARAGRWTQVQDLMAEAGFVLDTGGAAATIDTGQKSFNQFMADKLTKRDLVLNFRKPASVQAGPVLAAARPRGPSPRQIIRQFLVAHPGTTKDRIYDDFVRRLIRDGRMKAHDFDALLRSVAREEIPPTPTRPQPAGRWYVREKSSGLD